MRSNALEAEVVRVAQTMHKAQLVVGSQGNVSVRDGDRVYITPSDLPYERLHPQAVSVMDMKGASLKGPPPSSEHRVHLAIYRARQDVQAVVHTHSVHATAWSFLNEPLMLSSEEQQHFIGGAIQTAAFAPAGTDKLARETVAALGARQAVLLAGHGVVGVGPCAQDALNACFISEQLAQMAWLLRNA